MRYRAGPHGDYVVRPVDDLTLVYHRPAGVTHVVAPVVAAVLDILCGSTLTPPEIVAALSQRHSFDADPESVQTTISARLAELAALDLVDRVA